MPFRPILIFAFYFSLSLVSTAQVNNMLADGDWVKIGVTKSGIYKIDLHQLSQHSSGFRGIELSTIQLFGTGGQMLPQRIDSESLEDIPECHIMVNDDGDGIFNDSDYLLFYGQSPHEGRIDSKTGSTHYIENFYTDTAYYFLTHGRTVGKRISQSALVSGTLESVNDVFTYQIYDDNSFNLLHSGRIWYGLNFDKPGSKKKVVLKNPMAAEDAQHHVQMIAMAHSLEPADFTISYGGNSLANLPIAYIEDASGEDKAYSDTVTFDFASSLASELEFEIAFNSSDRRSYGFLDKILVTTRSPLKYSNQQQVFVVPAGSGSRSVSIENSIETLNAWDITDGTVPEVLNIENGTMKVASTEEKRMILFDDSDVMIPSGMSIVPNVSFNLSDDTELLIVTHPRFVSQAIRLANYREQNSSIKSEIVTTSDIYNRYSSGSQDVTAIRNCIHQLWLKGSLKYVLLLGDASYDYKYRLKDNTNYVPTYQTWETLNEVNSFCSDDFYSFMEIGEGEWTENSKGIHSMDLAVGRLPARNEEQAKVAVDKLIHYDTASDLTNWRNKMLFISDDGDDNLFNNQTERLANYIDQRMGLKVEKLYIDEYPQPSQYTELGRKEFLRKLEEGVLIIDYVGHGNEEQLSAERLLMDYDIPNMRNLDRLPFYFTATCNFGNYDDPVWYSAGEQLIFEPTGGGIGLITATRQVYATVNNWLNREFGYVLAKELYNSDITIGEIFRQTKNNSYRSTYNRSYVLLGDPSLRLSAAAFEMEIDSMLNESGEKIDDFLTLSEIEIFGSVRFKNDTLLASHFNGALEFTVYEPPIERTTLGTDNEPFDYEIRKSILVSRSSKIENGKFRFKTFLPAVNSDGRLLDSKMILYGKDTEMNATAIGSSYHLTFVTGVGTTDTDAPTIHIYIGDTLFESGNDVPSDSRLLVRLQDASGINLSLSDTTKSLSAILDGKMYMINESYVSDLESYRSGWVKFSMPDLSVGSHTITVSASDIFGNTATSSVQFEIVHEKVLAINDFKLYPNPSHSQDVNIFFKHDTKHRSIKVTCDLINLRGELVDQSEFYIENSQGEVSAQLLSSSQILKLNLKAGLYFLQTTIRSLDTNARTEITSRVLLN